MTLFISYAQNGEDVLLWRALGHIENGFYIDVGANDTEEHSVTKVFYDRGWSGINVEPVPFYQQRLAEQRPRDINLGIAAGSEAAAITFYDVENVRGWGTLDPQVAAKHRADGNQVSETLVQVLPLAEICAQHVRGPIHFLKIDVEGFEEQALRGMDFTRWRPWVLVIEATLPNSTETCHENWEHLLLTRDYQFTYFDGLNRYYVAAEHAELKAKLQVQPNVFDDYVTNRMMMALQASEDAHQDALHHQLVHYQHSAHAQWQAEHSLRLHQVQHLKIELHLLLQENLRNQQKIAELQVQLPQLQQFVQSKESELQEAHQRIIAIYNSASWRITSPLRGVKHYLQRAKNFWRHISSDGSALRGLSRYGKHIIVTQMAKIMRTLATQPRVRALLLPHLMRWPGLRERLRDGVEQVIPRELPNVSAHILQLPAQPLSAPAQQLFDDLQRARSHH
jgi:FkbM family methyltransferase